MSLIRTALRIAAVEAVRGRTLIGDNVLDSQNGSLDVAADGTLRTDQDMPFISVYLYDGKAKGLSTRSLVENGTAEVAFEIGIAAAMAVTDPETGESVIAGMPATDRVFEFQLDLAGRQIRDALTDPDNEWGQIFLSLTTGIAEVALVATRHSDGQRVAGHQLMLTVPLIDDPVLGVPIDAQSPFGRFLAVAEAGPDPVYGEMAAAIRAALAGDPELRDWRVLQRRLGLTAGELLALGRGPIAQDTDRATPGMTQATAAVAGVGETVIVP